MKNIKFPWNNKIFHLGNFFTIFHYIKANFFFDRFPSLWGLNKVNAPSWSTPLSRGPDKSASPRSPWPNAPLDASLPTPTCWRRGFPSSAWGRTVWPNITPRRPNVVNKCPSWRATLLLSKPGFPNPGLAFSLPTNFKLKWNSNHISEFF